MNYCYGWILSDSFMEIGGLFIYTVIVTQFTKYVWMLDVLLINLHFKSSLVLALCDNIKAETD